MKKVLIGLVTAASIASADFLGFSAGAGMWQENIDGYVKSGDDINYFNNKAAENDGDDNTGNLGLSDEVKPYVWGKFIHPLPLIPNVRAEYRQYHTSGDGIAVGSIEIFGKNINLKDKVHTDITMNSYDVTAFYELKIFAEVEAGVGVNVLDGTTEVTKDGDTTTVDWISPIPYLYARAETPHILGFSAEAQMKFLDVGTAFYHDYQAALKYHVIDTIVDFSVTAGYKLQEIYAEDGDNETDMKFSGAYLELGARW